MALNEYGIEGMGVVSTRADEGRATISADGQRIVFARRGEAGWRLWQARGGRPLAAGPGTAGQRGR